MAELNGPNTLIASCTEVAPTLVTTSALGKFPWEGLSHEQIQQEVLSGRRPNMTIEAGKDSKLIFLKALVTSCWDADPNSRP